MVTICLFPQTGFPYGSAGKESTLDSIPGLGRSPGERKGYPLQYSALENSMDSVVHGVAKSWTQLSDFHFHIIDSMYKIQVTSENILYSTGNST